MKLLDYEGLKQVVGKIKGLIEKKADKDKFEKLEISSKFIDTKDTDESPQWYIENHPYEIVKEFKKTLALGLHTKTDAQYCLLITMQGWEDSSGGYPIQICLLTKNMQTYFRLGLDNVTWSSWGRFLDEIDLKLSLSQLKEDPTHRTVTDAEKTKWNNITNVERIISSDILVRLKQVESGLYEDITGNPFTINFKDLNGIKFTNGVFNEDLSRLEC
ncbi:hypothetical protein [Anaerococcus sp. Marseille-P3625]|uniref:hypothetical protein n=1 Tax=Anaerococcus sp. Marseille-P3625 TaxID=1977277 RepID=UPI000C082B1B|nr:hypothetical protein [Anaerococcus sp. Marseille-P3625]